MATFFFRAVASDGKVRSGSLVGDDEKLIARELRKWREAQKSAIENR